MSELISVIIPVYNRGEQVLSAISCVEHQTYGCWEILLIDDGSDQTDYQKEISDERVRIINIGSNKGVSYARNVGIRHASGEWIAFLDSDNLWESDFLERMHRCIHSTNTSAVFCQWNYVYGERQVPGLSDYATQLLSEILELSDSVSHYYTVNAQRFLTTAVYGKTNFTHINAVMVKADIVELFDEALQISEDTYWIYCLLMKVPKVGYLTCPLLRFISNADSLYLYCDRNMFTDFSQLSADLCIKLSVTQFKSAKAYQKLEKIFRSVYADPMLAEFFRDTWKNKLFSARFLERRASGSVKREKLKELPLSKRLCGAFRCGRIKKMEQSQSYVIDIY